MTRPTDTPAGKAHVRGRAYEESGAAYFLGLGFCVRLHDDENAHDHDLIIDGLPVEFKGSIPHSYNGGKHSQGFQFAIKRTTGTVTECEIVILWCAIDPPALFVVPRADLNGAHSITIPNRTPGEYRGKWSKFYYRIDLLKEAVRKFQEEELYK